MTAHPYLVIVSDSAGKRTHRFSALHHAETFCKNLRRDAELGGYTVRLTLMAGEQVRWRC